MSAISGAIGTPARAATEVESQALRVGDILVLSEEWEWDRGLSSTDQAVLSVFVSNDCSREVTKSWNNMIVGVLGASRWADCGESLFFFSVFSKNLPGGFAGEVLVVLLIACADNCDCGGPNADMLELDLDRNLLSARSKYSEMLPLEWEAVDE